MSSSASASEGPFVVVRELSKRFGGDWALARASFSLQAGSMALLTGANGSGKTTLIRCLSTALAPDFGSATVGGRDIVSERDRVRPQIASLGHPAGFYGGLSARENLLLTFRALGLTREESIDEALHRVGLARREGTPLDELSSGLRQRVSLARLLVLQRRLVLLDEPETHLDASGLALLQELMVEWKARGTAIVCATHAPERFQTSSDAEIRLMAGRPEGLERP